MEKPALADAVGVSRSTVNRAVRELESHGLIAQTDAGYSTTTLGGLAASKVAELGDTIRIGTRLEPFLRWIPADELDLDLRTLVDAELYVPEPNDPYVMINRHVNVLEEAQEHRYGKY